jgi:DNA-binding response OmpR family regulator
MGANRTRPGADSAERVLVVASATEDCAALAHEIAAREGLSRIALDVPSAAEALRTDSFDVIMLHARPDPAATLLLLTLLRAQAKGGPLLLLVVDPDAIDRHSAAATLADETMAATLSARRMCDAAGIGLRSGFSDRRAFG